jgi:S-adenosylmethionine:diacylglycerol 3-amino-3-carboxypropyl transferase
MNRIIFIGRVGSDAGSWYIGSDHKIHRIPGWNPEQLSDVTHMLQGLREFSQVKTAGVAERAVSVVLDSLKQELGAHLKEGDLLVLGG